MQALNGQQVEWQTVSEGIPAGLLSPQIHSSGQISPATCDGQLFQG